MGSLKYNYKNNRISIPPITKKPRVIRNLLQTDFSTWSVSDLPNTGDGAHTITTTDDTNDTVSFTTVTEGAGRMYLHRTTSTALDAGKYYSYGVELDTGSTGTFTGSNCSVNFTPSEGVTNVTMTATGSRYYFNFRPDTSAVKNFRLGQGTGVDTTLTTGEILKVKRVFLYEIPNMGAVPPEWIPYDVCVALPYDDNSTAVSNIITESTGSEYEPRAGSTVLCVSDSFGNDNNDFPAQLNIQNRREVYNASVSGDAMDDFLVTYQTWLATPQTRFPRVNTPKVVIFGTGVNDIFADRNLATLQANVQLLVQEARDNNMIPVVLNIPPFGTYVSHTAGRQTVALAYNAWLASQTDFLVVDIFSGLLDKSTTFTQLASFGSGDGLHPTTSGSVMIANVINEKLKEIENQCDF